MLKQAHAISEEIIEWRRDFHMHPEIGFEIHRTSKIVADELEKMGYRVRRRLGKTGVAAELGEGGTVIAIRADMDALPILEQNEVEYASQNPGAMHACGHDSHTAMAPGAAMLLAKEKLPGRVRFLFQLNDQLPIPKPSPTGWRWPPQLGDVVAAAYMACEHGNPNSGAESRWPASRRKRHSRRSSPHSTTTTFLRSWRSLTRAFTAVVWMRCMEFLLRSCARSRETNLTNEREASVHLPTPGCDPPSRWLPAMGINQVSPAALQA